MLSKLQIDRANPPNIMLLFSMLLVISPHLLRIPVWLGLFCLALILWRFFYEAGKSRLPGQFLKLLLIILAVSTIITSYQTVVGRHAGSSFLLLLFCLKLIEFKTSRDAFVIVFLGFFIVITGFLFSQSIPIAIYMFLVLIALTSSLIAFQHPATWLFQSQHIRLAVRMLVFSFPLAVVLFLLFPRTSAPLWGLPEDAFSAKTGISDYMSPGQIGRLSNSDEVAFRVKFKNGLPPDNKLYWRGPVLWSFNGFTWSSPRKEQFAVQHLPYKGIGKTIEYSVTLEPHTRHWLFALDLPATILPDSKLTTEMLLVSLKPVHQIKKYDMQSYLDYRFIYPDLKSSTRYTRIPENIAPRTKNLVAQWKSNSTSEIQIVEKALQYFASAPFYYTRTPPLLFDDPIDEFIFKTQKGYCEHFSSAFTFMMRAAGLPARVVTGYYGGELNPLGDYMIVRQSDAHAWSEVYIEKRGWLRIDPTSIIPPTRIENSADVVRIQPKSDKAVNILKETSWLYRSYKNINNLVDSINNSWTQLIIGYNKNKQVALFDSFGIPEITWQGLSIVMFSLLSVFLLLFGYYLLIVKKAMIDPVNKIYARFCKKMKKRGYSKLEFETASHFAKRIAENEPALKSTVMKITSKYNTLHYGKYRTKTMLQALEDSIRAIKF